MSGYEDANVLTHGGLANRKKRGRRPLDCPEEKTKVKIDKITTLLVTKGQQLHFC